MSRLLLPFVLMLLTPVNTFNKTAIFLKMASRPETEGTSKRLMTSPDIFLHHSSGQISETFLFKFSYYLKYFPGRHWWMWD